MDPLNCLRTLVGLGLRVPQRVLVAALDQLGTKETDMAKKIAEFVTEFQTAFDNINAKVAAQGTIIGGVKTLLEGLVAQNAALKTQLGEALANGGDAETLQPILDALNAQDESIAANTDALAAAVTANTPQDPQG